MQVGSHATVYIQPHTWNWLLWHNAHLATHGIELTFIIETISYLTTHMYAHTYT